jgi:hypothetical protein
MQLVFGHKDHEEKRQGHEDLLVVYIEMTSFSKRNAN